ncbi:MAG TPA: hypothetical protein VFM79_06480 [Pelobium sp.]|nr:hypothetical protein [Pelobium sp.]
MKFNLILALFCLIAIKAQAQQDSSKKTTLTVATVYSSNVSYYGQATNEKLPYILANATVRFPIGLYLSAGSYKLINYGSGISEVDLGIGYNYDFNEKLHTGINFTHFFFPTNSPLLQSANENNVNSSVSYHWTWFKSTLSTDYAFGKQNDIFISLSHAKEISLGTIFNKKNSIFIEPEIEFTAGTQHFYQTYIIEKGKRDQAKGNGKGLELPRNSDITIINESDSFNLLSYNFKIPLSLSHRNYIAEVSYQLSVLGPNAQAELKKQQSFFSLAFYYQF